MIQSKIRSNVLFLNINKFSKLSTRPAIKKTVIYGLHLLKSAFVLYPIIPSTANIIADTTNKYTIEYNSKTANITDRVTPLIIEYTKYSIPTAHGGNFLNNRLKTMTATNSTINKILK